MMSIGNSVTTVKAQQIFNDKLSKSSSKLSIMAIPFNGFLNIFSSIPTNSDWFLRISSSFSSSSFENFDCVRVDKCWNSPSTEQGKSWKVEFDIIAWPKNTQWLIIHKFKTHLRIAAVEPNDMNEVIKNDIWENVLELSGIWYENYFVGGLPE